MLNFFIFILGTIIGSFLNVCIYRIPRCESIVFPPSHCPHCGYRLAPGDLVPILSFIAIKGRCRECGAKISPLYPFVEISTGLLFVLAFQRYGFSYMFLSSIILLSTLIISAFVDMEHGIIPDKVTIPSIALGLFIHGFFIPSVLADSISGCFLGAGSILLIVILSKGGMGGGDIKLFAVAGMFLGLGKTLLSLFLSFVFGSVAGILLIIVKKKGAKDSIPFGPFIALGGTLSMLYGDMIISWYLNSIF